MHLTVDGEKFSVEARPGASGVYDFTWLTGPDPDYGFTLGTSDETPLSNAHLERAARNFLEQIDPETGHIE